MQGNNTNSDKTTGHGLKPATIEKTDGTTIDATHHIITDDGEYVHAYLGDRSGGIDVSESQRLVTDGGRNIDAERGDHIWLNGQWHSFFVQNVTEFHPDDPGNDTDEVRIAVGGHEDPMDPGYIDPRRVERCSESGDLTDGTVCACDADDVDHNGIPVVTGAVPGNEDDDDDDEQEPRLVTDGGLVGPRQSGPHADRYDPDRYVDDDEEPPAKHEIAAQDDDQTTFGGEW